MKRSLRTLPDPPAQLAELGVRGWKVLQIRTALTGWVEEGDSLRWGLEEVGLLRLLLCDRSTYREHWAKLGKMSHCARLVISHQLEIIFDRARPRPEFCELKLQII